MALRADDLTDVPSMFLVIQVITDIRSRPDHRRGLSQIAWGHKHKLQTRAQS